MTRLCVVENCAKPPRSGAADLCAMHYHRVYRTGSLERRKPKDSYSHSNGYVQVRVPDHPLAQRRGHDYEYEHRVVFYDAHGEGPFMCHWCDRAPLFWDVVQIDHKDGVRDNNAILNLVPSCRSCNRARANPRLAATARAKGRQLTLNDKTMCLSEWAREIGITPAALTYRLDKASWTTERALTTPRGSTGPQ